MAATAPAVVLVALLVLQATAAASSNVCSARAKSPWATDVMLIQTKTSGSVTTLRNREKAKSEVNPPFQHSTQSEFEADYLVDDDDVASPAIVSAHAAASRPFSPEELSGGGPDYGGDTAEARASNTEESGTEESSSEDRGKTENNTLKNSVSKNSTEESSADKSATPDLVNDGNATSRSKSSSDDSAKSENSTSKDSASKSNTEKSSTKESSADKSFATDLVNDGNATSTSTGIAEGSVDTATTNSSACVTRADPRAVAFGYETSVSGTPCVFGADLRDEGSHCIMDDGKYGSFGWCFTSMNMTSWGSCAEACPLFGPAKVLAAKIDSLESYTKEFAKTAVDAVKEAVALANATENVVTNATVALANATAVLANATATPNATAGLANAMAALLPTEAPIEKSTHGPSRQMRRRKHQEPHRGPSPLHRANAKEAAYMEEMLAQEEDDDDE